MNKEEIVAYVKALVYIATEDEKIDEEEKKYFKQIGNAYGLSEDETTKIMESIIKKKEPMEDILANITERSSKLTLIYDLLALCYADGNYAIAERNGMKNICGIMKIEESKLSEMESIMEESVKLQKKVNEVLER